MMRSPCMNNVGKNLVLKVRPSFSLQLPKDQMKEKALAAFQTIKYISSNKALASHWPVEFPILHVLKKVQIGSSPENNSLPLSYLVVEHLRSKNFDRTVIQQFEAMMDPSRGIILPTYLTVQQRMTAARLITNQYAFFPNRITTPLIFRTLLQFQKKRLMYGEAGTAKTSGICSFCQLASMVTDYIVTYDDDGLDSQIKRIPKIFYFSYKEDEDNSDMKKRYINYGNMLKLQCPKQIFPQQLLTFINNNNNYSMVNKVRSIILSAYRNKDIEVKVVVDQINTLAARFKQYNNTFEKANEQKKNEMKNLGKQLEQQKQLWVRGNLNFADKSSVLFNSSVNIEKDVLDRSIGDKIGLDLNHHEKLPRTGISYFNAFRQFPDQAHSELVHAIFFELIKTACSLNNHDAVTKIKQAQKNLKRDQVKIDELASITHLQIRQYLQGNDQFLPFINKVQSPKIGEYILQLIQELNNNFINALRQQSKKFHTQSENKEKRLLLLVLVRNLIKNNPKTELTFKNIQLEARSNINFQEQHVDNCLFNFKKNRVQRKIQMKFQPSVFLKATDFANFEFQSVILKNFDLFQQNFKNNPAIVGYLLEAYIFGFLKSASVVRIEFLNSKVSSCQKTAGKEFYQFYHFLSYINGQYVMSLQKRLKQGFQSKDKNEKTFFFQPITSSDEKESLNNPSVDLLILKKIETDKYEITTVDFTVTSDTGQINKKKLKTENLIKKVFEKYYGSDSTEIKSPKIIKWSHVIAANLPKKVEDAKLNYPVFESFHAPISYPSNVKQPEFPAKAECSVEIVSIHNIKLVQLDQNSEAQVYSQLVSKVLKLAHKLANPQ